MHVSQNLQRKPTFSSKRPHKEQNFSQEKVCIIRRKCQSLKEFRKSLPKTEGPGPGEYRAVYILAPSSKSLRKK